MQGHGEPAAAARRLKHSGRLSPYFLNVMLFDDTDAEPI